MRKKYSTQEKQEIIRRYKESGKTAAQFGRDNEISAINIQRWIKKEENKANNAAKESDTNFVEIKKNNILVNSKEQTIAPSIVLACNGCALQIADGFNQVTLKNILAVVKEL
ncbi:IS66 family insertion sequence element accessory protein TnpA [Sedimentibacter sp.]|uniref:IS66 family insertion sequence element accessory protein TnpA n=1 Tax=Sedimentibacter sp. TaxID=1960295 RepID=UPI0028A68656|nr:transposase [Sedimentibacter sp.]